MMNRYLFIIAHSFPIYEKDKTMNILTIANQKGGVGKTTTAVTVAHGLAIASQYVLLVDLDPQGQVAFSLGKPKEPGFYRLIVDEEPVEKVAVPTRENLDIIFGDKRTEKAKRTVVISNFPNKSIARALRGVDYDVVILDLPPSLGVLHVSALMASDWVLIPTRLDAMAVDGVNEVLRSMAEVVDRGRQPGYSILPTFYDRTTRETEVQLQALFETFKERVWPPIPQDTKAREATAQGKTLLEYCPDSPVIRGVGEEKTGGYISTIARLMEVLDG